MLELFRQRYTPETLPYHLVVPSLPGYTLSRMPRLNHDISQVDVARIMDSLMKQIGIGEGYVVQGGDVGSRVARVVAVNHDSWKGKQYSPLKKQLLMTSLPAIQSKTFS